jgi:membrane protease YdiL (CAAX protease family)
MDDLAASPRRTVSPKRALAVFFAVLVPTTILIETLLITGAMRKSALAFFLLMWTPGVAALAVKFACDRSLRIGWRPGPPGYLAIGFFLPIVYALVYYGFAWSSGFGDFSLAGLAAEGDYAADWGGFRRYVVMLLTSGLAIGVLFALGEEIGWRGFLVPALLRTRSFLQASLIVGALWAVWHFPLIVTGDYGDPSTPLWFRLGCFLVSVLAISVVLTWLRMKSNSVWPSTLLHASHNLFIQSLFTPLTHANASSGYVIGEFGLGLAATTLLAACAVLWWRRRERTAA